MHVDSSACVKVKGGECVWFRIDGGVRRVCYVPLALQCIYRCSDEGREIGIERIKLRLL